MNFNLFANLLSYCIFFIVAVITFIRYVIKNKKNNSHSIKNMITEFFMICIFILLISMITIQSIQIFYDFDIYDYLAKFNF